LATLGQTFVQLPQLVGVLVVSTHDPLQFVGAVPGQPFMHE
jgi:hypothetical protein